MFTSYNCSPRLLLVTGIHHSSEVHFLSVWSFNVDHHQSIEGSRLQAIAIFSFYPSHCAEVPITV
ncbi:hypothetical protein DPMN_037790 [Dreissena polymorpha]|uniref:Uncharacterized protein n=1 Tax=Dreissena polymorpha TaxID=45954 RepID=A0A9D4RQ44_DREPO|nr:hypothetical protein DPMN_037790 [Dreissena polymorpha]